jgi:protein-S-isoprenylcysteine O-methyltransferase Ste14
MYKKRSIYINGIIIFTAGILCFLVFPRPVNAQSNLYIKILLNCIGFLVVLTGQFLRISARGYKSHTKSARAKLITDGPYNIVRNPMYLGSFLIGLGMFTILFPWWALPIYSVFFLLWYAYQIHGEQRKLEKKFGSEYVDYCSQVSIFFPKFLSFLKGSFFRSFPFKFIWIGKEWNTIIIWVSLIVFHEGYINIAIYPLVFFITEIIAFITILVVMLSLIQILCKPIPVKKSMQA